ncbi:IS66 family transposase [Ruminiclostridium sufflavum]|uniref:IS66 family transposase n=1 Tax=Ruminiclostridium sufflavum TaxID=396504 RepID=UPI000D7C8D84
MVYFVNLQLEPIYKTLREDRENSVALQCKRYCNRLFDIECDLHNLSPDERYQKRHELAKPVLDEFFVWLKSLSPATKTGLGQAVS